MSKIRLKKKKKQNLAIQLYHSKLKVKIFDKLCKAIMKQKGNRQHLMFQCHEKQMFPNIYIGMVDLNTLLYVNKRWYKMVLTYLQSLTKYKAPIMEKSMVPVSRNIELETITYCINLCVINFKLCGNLICDLDILKIAKKCLCVQKLDASFCNVQGNKHFQNAISNYWFTTLNTVALRGCPIEKFDTIDILVNKMPNMLRLDVGPKITQKNLIHGQRISKYKNRSSFFFRYTFNAAKMNNTNLSKLKVLMIAGVKTNLIEMIKILQVLKSIVMLDISWTRMFHDVRSIIDLLLCAPSLKFLECYGAMKHENNVSSHVNIDWINVEKELMKRLAGSNVGDSEDQMHRFLPPVMTRNKGNSYKYLRSDRKTQKIGSLESKVEQKRSPLKIYEQRVVAHTIYFHI
jgi:hypothetical protein